MELVVVSEKNINITEDLLKEVQSQKALIAKQKKAIELERQRIRRTYVNILFYASFIVTLILLALIINERSRVFLSNLFGLNSTLTPSDVIQILLGALGALTAMILIAKFLRDTVRSDEEILDSKNETALESIRKSYIKFKLFGFDLNLQVPSPEDKSVQNNEFFYLMEVGDCMWLEPVIYSRDRLLSEIRRLHSRSSGNLVTGMIMSGLGIVFLLSMVVFPSWYAKGIEMQVFSLNVDSKVFLFLFSQVLAGFFLKLFVGNEKSIAELNREILTLDYRIAAAFSGVETTVSSDIVQSFLYEERVKSTSNKKNSAPTSSLEFVNDSLAEVRRKIIQ